MKKLILSLLVIGLLVFSVGLAQAEIATHCSGGKCDGTDGCIKDETAPFQITVPGSVINKLWIKAGDGDGGCYEFTANDSDGCYSVSGIGTSSVSAVKVGSGSSCKDISHIEVVFTPTAVKIGSFAAEGTTEGILLTWETATELDQVGFNLYRSSGWGSWKKINSSLIPAQMPGSAFGADYSYLDKNVWTGVTYSYQLESLLIGGQTEMVGPVSAKKLSSWSSTRTRWPWGW